MKTDIAGTCWNCSRDLTKADYGREARCLGCDKPTRVCRNCRHFAPGRPNDCLEPMTERVLDKEKANFCERFDPTNRPFASTRNDPSDQLKRAEDLFK